MNFFKNFCSFAIVALALFTAVQTNAQIAASGLKIQINTEPSAAAYLKFDGVDGSVSVKEGRNVVGENTRTGEKLIIVVKSGKLTQFGVQPSRGSFKALVPTASPCNPNLTCTTFNPPHCYNIPGVGCVCVCGPWITSNSGRN